MLGVGLSRSFYKKKFYIGISLMTSTGGVDDDVRFGGCRDRT